MEDKNTILELEILTQTYDNLLTQYKKVQMDYLQQNLTTIHGLKYIGNKMDAKKVNSVTECSAVCSEVKNCTGATFHSNQKICQTYSGSGKIIAGTDNDYAIVQSLQMMKEINKDLIKVNKKIMNIINDKGITELEKQKDKRKEKYSYLHKNIESLDKEREIIEMKIKELESVNEKEEITKLEVNKNYSWFLTLFIIVFFIIIISKIIQVFTKPNNTATNYSS
jgi:hypothetical protein